MHVLIIAAAAPKTDPWVHHSNSFPHRQPPPLTAHRQPRAPESPSNANITLSCGVTRAVPGPISSRPRHCPARSARLGSLWRPISPMRSGWRSPRMPRSSPAGGSLPGGRHGQANGCRVGPWGREARLEHRRVGSRCRPRLVGRSGYWCSLAICVASPRNDRDRHSRHGGVGLRLSVSVSGAFEDGAEVAVQRRIHLAVPLAPGMSTMRSIRHSRTWSRYRRDREGWRRSADPRRCRPPPPHGCGIDHAGYYGAGLSAPFSIVRLWPMLHVILAAAFWTESRARWA